ncbi:carbohydrate ABC transporter permease [Paenibacillus sp. J2TS4]|uniref:carbohydrate ABC transporter permease n=1 Tax=Paenibacillus sp. J2TS4 TaxID=2807194 RepID=UPI001B2506A3|nr:carbohydrate ABC transporter permease [Paenibacillus sp. J2TS4]GIP36050.1 sugar ABC transporter permease [Paenibacillus sp. J2TS4]
MRTNSRKWSADKWFDIFNYLLLTGVLLIVLYPLYFIFIASLSEPLQVSAGNVKLWPKNFTFEGYMTVFKESSFLKGFRNSLFYAAFGTLINLMVTLPAAYSLSRSDLKGRNIFTFIFVFTMFFSGGLIPLYIIVKDLGILNTVWALVLPGALSVWNLIIARTFFQMTISKEILEAAKIDGASNTRFFLTIVLPLSKALIAVMILFYGVGHWNTYFNALIFVRDRELFPLQLVLREMLVLNTLETHIMDRQLLEKRQSLAESMKYSAIMISSIPVLILYPFLQRYFVKGIMIGSLKG